MAQPITLRPYQVEPVRKAIEYFQEEHDDAALMVFPTAWGKSILAAEVAAACPDPILVVQPTKELLAQNIEKYRALCGMLAPAGVYSASFGKKQIEHVTFATIGSIKSVGAQFKALGFKKMLIDEAHLYPRKEASMLGEFLRDSGIRQVLGITATPLKLEQFNVKNGEKFDKWSELIMLTSPSQDGSFFKSILYVGQIQEITAMRFWSPLKYEIIPFNPQDLRLNSSGGEYSDDAQEQAYKLNNIRYNIYAALDYHQERKHILVFVPSVEEAGILADGYPDAAMVCGETPKKERDRIINEFKEGKIRVVFNANVLSTGFDYPKIDMIILGFSTASVAKYYQICGRAVRIDPEKTDAVIVDMGGNVARFGQVEDIFFKYGFDGRWRMYGTDGRLLTGLPMQCVGIVNRKDICEAYARKDIPRVITFGKHKGKSFGSLPMSYLYWLASNPNTWRDIYLACLKEMENYLKDTTHDPPQTVFPDGQYAGETFAFAPRGYLLYYYNSKSWNETNDSLRRGLILAIGYEPHPKAKTTPKKKTKQ